MLYNIPMKKYIIILILIVLIFTGFFACPFYNFTGVPCPACGITRACKLFLTGRIKDAFIMHPLFWMPAIFLFKPLRKKWIVVTFITIFISVYIVRMAIMFPDTPPFNYNYNSILGEFIK